MIAAAAREAATRTGAQVSVIHDADDDWALPVKAKAVVSAGLWAKALAGVAADATLHVGDDATLDALGAHRVIALIVAALVAVARDAQQEFVFGIR